MFAIFWTLLKFNVASAVYPSTCAIHHPSPFDADAAFAVHPSIFAIHHPNPFDADAAFATCPWITSTYLPDENDVAFDTPILHHPDQVKVGPAVTLNTPWTCDADQPIQTFSSCAFDIAEVILSLVCILQAFLLVAVRTYNWRKFPNHQYLHYPRPSNDNTRVTNTLCVLSFFTLLFFASLMPTLNTGLHALKYGPFELLAFLLFVVTAFFPTGTVPWGTITRHIIFYGVCVCSSILLSIVSISFVVPLFFWWLQQWQQQKQQQHRC